MKITKTVRKIKFSSENVPFRAKNVDSGMKNGDFRSKMTKIVQRVQYLQN